MDRRLMVSSALGVGIFPCLAPAMISPPLPHRVRLINLHTGESFEGAYRDAAGPLASAMTELSDFLRDFHSGAKITIDVGLIDFLSAVMNAVSANSAGVLSAYRTPETNAALAETGFGVAENSQHLYGRALDITLGPKLADAVSAARAMKRGGVGWYPRSGFLHIDTGPVRNWDLAERDLASLLFKGSRAKQYHTAIDDRYTPELNRSGQLRPEMNDLGRLRPEMTRIGRSRPHPVAQSNSR